jgi:hypothetical protein
MDFGRVAEGSGGHPGGEPSALAKDDPSRFLSVTSVAAGKTHIAVVRVIWSGLSAAAPRRNPDLTSTSTLYTRVLVL